MYVTIRVIRVLKWSARASALSGLHKLSDEFFRAVIQPSNGYMHIFYCTLEIIEIK
jgi:hypothetical protein